MRVLFIVCRARTPLSHAVFLHFRCLFFLLRQLKGRLGGDPNLSMSIDFLWWVACASDVETDSFRVVWHSRRLETRVFVFVWFVLFPASLPVDSAAVSLGYFSRYMLLFIRIVSVRLLWVCLATSLFPNISSSQISSHIALKFQQTS